MIIRPELIHLPIYTRTPCWAIASIFIFIYLFILGRAVSPCFAQISHSKEVLGLSPLGRVHVYVCTRMYISRLIPTATVCVLWGKWTHPCSSDSNTMWFFSEKTSVQGMIDVLFPWLTVAQTRIQHAHTSPPLSLGRDVEVPCKRPFVETKATWVQSRAEHSQSGKSGQKQRILHHFFSLNVDVILVTVTKLHG